MSLLFRCKLFFNHLQNKNVIRHVRQLHKSVPKWNTVQVDLASERQVFRKVASEVIDCAVSSPNVVIPKAETWIRELLEYSMTDMTVQSGVMVPIAYQMMENPENITEKSLHDAHVLGWCVEMMQLYTILLDDILDNSITRFGKLCWHKRPGVGPRVLIDSMLMHTSMIEVLQATFGKTNNYPLMIKAFNKAEMLTGIGQRLDYDSALKNNRDAIKSFTSENYHNIAVYKSAASISLQMELTCLLLKNSILEMDNNEKFICDTLSKLVLITDDYADVYYENVCGDTSTDISEGKCTWLAVKAFQLANDAQKEVLCNNYGKEGPENEKRIKELFNELKLPEYYRNARKVYIEDLKTNINNVSHDGMKIIFNYLSEVYIPRLLKG